jgi:hypothetical protein
MLEEDLPFLENKLKYTVCRCTVYNTLSCAFLVLVKVMNVVDII